jgi:prepilin-type N-terminal cleavage/methylation domain-containing protein
MTNRGKQPQGFTLLELIVAMGIFLVICAAMFELLDLSQKKYNSETQLTAAYQDARLALDQIVRDVDESGYPSVRLFSSVPLPSSSNYAIAPVAWSPNYPITDCQIGSCMTPGDYDLVVETRLGTDTFVSWVWYHLDTSSNILYRAVVPKSSGDPLSVVSSSQLAVPLIANVMNNPGSATIAQITASYSSMFPGNRPQPIFQYGCATATGTVPCSLAGPYNAARNITDVNVTLIVATPQRDAATQQIKLVELTGRGHRVNPD